MMAFHDDLNGHEAARPFAEDYRSPDKPAVRKGEADMRDEGDKDGDGFNEGEGCYVLRSSAEGLAFTLRGSAVPRLYPVFKVKDWTGAAPASLAMGDRKLVAGQDFLVSKSENVLLLQLLKIVREDIALTLKP